MSNQNLNSLVTPWWVLWETKSERSPVFKVLRESWRAQLKRAKDASRRRLTWTALAEILGMQYYGLNSRRSGKYFTNSSLPVHEILMQAAALDVHVSDLLPTPRELFNQATTDLIRQYEQRNPDGEFGLAPKAMEAYVEYHLACPEAQRDYRRPDPEAVERAYRALRSKFRDADETARWIVKTAKAIEHIYYFDGGG